MFELELEFLRGTLKSSTFEKLGIKRTQPHYRKMMTFSRIEQGYYSITKIKEFLDKNPEVTKHLARDLKNLSKDKKDLFFNAGIKW